MKKTMKDQTQTQWTAIYCNRKFLPPQLVGDRETISLQLENLLMDRHLLGIVEVMTDQIEVIIRGRKVAIYMP